MTAGKDALRLAFYGDDFTGSTDALEVLAFAGWRCALFLQPPTPEALRRFGTLDAIGVAGDSRGMSPAEMDAALPPVLQALGAVAPLVHYKVCSTFDSAPRIGSIGRVIEIARGVIGGGLVPLVAGNPALGRYCVFGHLFARSGTDGQVHRIDRHPIMCVHPVTPMDEADLALHIGRQAPLSIAKLTLAELERGPAAVDEAVAAHERAAADALLIDATTPAHLTEAGRVLTGLATRRAPVFVVGSSGVEYALTQSAPPAAQRPDFSRFEPVDRLLVVSGSASALTALQIEQALAAGFVDLPVQADALVDEARWPAARDTLVQAAVNALHQGRSPLLHTARGPQDARIGHMLEALAARGMSREQARHEGGRLLARRLGELTREILARVPLRRVVLSGGDTSSQVTQVLAPQALTVAARLAPGAPLCRLHADDPALDGVELALKGGQMGGPDYFVRALRATT